MKFKTSTVQRISFVLAILFFGMAILGIVGEVAGRAEPVLGAAEAAGLGQMLGWWNDIGEVLTIVGTLGGLLVAWTALAAGSTEEQVDRVHRAVVDNGEQLEKLEDLDKLDVIQLELDRQTDVLGDQLSVLTQVRDRL